MKKILVVITLFVSVLLPATYVMAQTTITENDTTSALPSQTENPYTFAHSSHSINSLFSDVLRPGAHNRFTIDFDYNGNSNAAPALFLYRMLFKGPITEQLKDRVNNRLRKELRFEDNMRTGISYKHHFKKWDGQLILAYHHRQMRNIGGPKQTYQLIFYGNAMFEGQTADLSNIRFQNFIYNQYIVGIYKEIKYPKYTFGFGVSGAFLQGINQQQIYTGQSSVYTAPDGEYIDFNYDLTFNTAKEGATGFGELNGLGASADVHISFRNANRWKVAFDLSDVGYMMHRKNKVNYTGAKSVRFEGIVIPDLLSFSAQTFDTLNLDSTVRANLPYKTQNDYSVMVPFTAALTFSHSFLNNKLVMDVGAQYRYMSNYYLYGFVRANYFIKSDMIFSASAGAGGYAMFNLGVSFAKHWKYFDLTVGTTNLLGLAVPTHMPGSSIFLRLGSSF